MTVHEKFVEDMRAVGIVTAAYRGRFFWEVPPPVPINRMVQHFRISSRKPQFPFSGMLWDSNYIVYPVGKAKAGWNDNVADPEGEEVEPGR